MGGGQTLRISLLLLCFVHLGLSAVLQKRATTTALREGCFPRPGEKAGCRCTTKDPNGHDVTKILETDAECAIKHDPQQIENKQKVLEELKTDVANLKDGCYPRPSNVGCRCTEKDANGHDVAKVFETDAECRTDAEPLNRKKRNEEAVGHHEGDGHDHSGDKKLVGGKTTPHGAAAGSGVQQREKRHGNDGKPEHHEGDGHDHSDDNNRRKRHGDDGKPEHHEGDGHDHSGDKKLVGGKTTPHGAAAGAGVQQRMKRHGDDGKPEHHEGDGHDHSNDKKLVGGKTTPHGAAAGSGVQQREKRHDGDGKPEHHEGDGHDHSGDKKLVGGKTTPHGAAAGVGAQSESEKVVRRVRRGDADISHASDEAAETPKVEEASVAAVKPPTGGEIHEQAAAVDTPVGGRVMPEEVATAAAGGAAETDDSERVPRHDGDGLAEHHKGDGHDHSGDKKLVGGKTTPHGAAAGSGAQQRVKRHDGDGKPEHHEGDGHDHSKDATRRRRDATDAAAIPAGGADATAREAAAGAASGGAIAPTTIPKSEDRPEGVRIQSDEAAVVMGEVAEHIDESARRRREAVQQPRDRPATAGGGVHGAKQQQVGGGLDQNVRDPVREKAAQNYQAVLNELKDKFRGLKEGCYPRPKGCLCVIGKDADGRDRTERRMKDADCKCQPGERGAGCPAEGA